MALNTNLLKVKSTSLEEGPMRYWSNNEIFVKNGTKRYSQCTDSSQSIKGIVKLMLITFIICIGFMVLIEVPYQFCVSTTCSTNALIDSSVQMDDIKVDGPSVNYDSISSNDKQWSKERDNELTSGQNQIYTDPITNASDESVETDVSSTPNVERNYTPIHKLLMLYQEILKKSETSFSDEEVSKEADTLSIFPEFRAMMTFANDFSDIDSHKKICDPDLTRFWQALSNSDVWGSDNESRNGIVELTDKFTSPSGLEKKSHAEINSVTTLLNELKHRQTKSNDMVLKNEIDIKNHCDSPGELDLEVEDWERSWNATCERLDGLAAEIVTGNSSDPMTIKLRKQFIEMVKVLVWRVPLLPSNETSSENRSENATTETWCIYLQTLKQGIRRFANVDHQQETVVPTQEMEIKFRDIVERLNRVYSDWVKIAMKSVLVRKPGINTKTIKLECRKCASTLNTTFERLNYLAVKVIDGSSTDPSVAKLRRKIVRTGVSLAWRVTLVRSHLSKQKWNIFTSEIKKEIARLTESELGQNFEARKPKLRDIVNELYDIVEHFHRDCISCDTILRFHTYVMKFKENNLQEYEKNVDSILTTEYNCQTIVRHYSKTRNPFPTKIMYGNPKLESVTEKAEIKILNGIKEDSRKYSKNIYWHLVSNLKPSVRRRKRSTVWNSGNSMDDPNLITSKQFDSSLELFFDKMEVLSAHIDRLHERYLTLNELNDDYISREFSVESELTDDGIV